MATISLYSDKINRMPGLIKQARMSVDNLKSDLSSLRSHLLNIDSSVCNIDIQINEVMTSTQTQERTITSLNNFSTEMDDFINEVVNSDYNVSDVINQRKDDFYNKYSYLKPECEKSAWEKVKDGLKKSWEWCKDHWKAIVIVVLIIAAVAVIIFCPAAGLWLILIGAAK